MDKLEILLVDAVSNNILKYLRNIIEIMYGEDFRAYVQPKDNEVIIFSIHTAKIREMGGIVRTLLSPYPYDYSTAAVIFKVLQIKATTVKVVAKFDPSFRPLVDSIFLDLDKIFDQQQESNEHIDPMDQRILDLLKKDPKLSDGQLGQTLGLSRQAINSRRQKLRGIGLSA